MRNIVVLGGSSHPDLTDSICRNLTVERGQVDLSKFSNGETSVTMRDSVREKDVFIIQSGCGHVNDNFFELLIMISACKTASARRVTAVLPLFPYSRQADIPFAKSGVPLISQPKLEYTFESVPGTPRPFSSNSNTPPTQNFESSNNNLINRAIQNIKLQPIEGLAQPVAISPSKSRIPTFPVYQPSFLNPSPSLLSIESSATNTAHSSHLNVGKSNSSNNENGKSEISKNVRSKSGYKQWIAQNGTLIANLLTTAGADRCITMDLHDPQFQGFFDIPVENLYSKPLLKHYIQDYIPNYQECVIVSPDAGGAKRATTIADQLGCSFALIHKERRHNIPKQPPSTNATNNTMSPSKFVSLNDSVNNVVATTMLVGEVKDRVCVIIDDLVDTSYTITRAAKLLKDQGAKYVYAIISHGVFSGDATRRIKASDIDKIITTNSVPQKKHVEELGDMIEVLDVSRILAESIRRIHNGESVSMLFDHGW